MTAAAKRVAIVVATLSLVLLGSGIVTDQVTAQCDLSQPEDMKNCEDPSMNPFTGVLDNVFLVAKTILQYLGFVAVFAGATLWFTSGRNSDRGQYGVWLLVGGLGMVMFFFGYSALISVAKGIAGA